MCIMQKRYLQKLKNALLDETSHDFYQNLVLKEETKGPLVADDGPKQESNA